MWKDDDDDDDTGASVCILSIWFHTLSFRKSLDGWSSLALLEGCVSENGTSLQKESQEICTLLIGKLIHSSSIGSFLEEGKHIYDFVLNSCSLFEFDPGLGFNKITIS